MVNSMFKQCKEDTAVLQENVTEMGRLIQVVETEIGLLMKTQANMILGMKQNKTKNSTSQIKTSVESLANGLENRLRDGRHDNGLGVLSKDQFEQ